jgi:hypothetical protein
MDYFDTHNILLQKNDNYADFLEYTHTGGPKNLDLFRNLQIWHSRGMNAPYFYTIVPNRTFFITFGKLMEVKLSLLIEYQVFKLRRGRVGLYGCRIIKK